MRKMILGFAVAIMLMAASAQAQGAVWSATFTPGDINGYAFGCRNGDDDAECSNKDVLSDDTFTVGEIVYTVTEFYQTSGTNRLYFAGIRTPEDGTSWVDIADELKIGSTSLDIGDAFLSQGQNNTSAWRLRWSGDPGLDDVLGGDSLTDGTSISVTLISGDLPPAGNTLATGAPTITGTAQVGQTLTAGTTAIMDADGLTSVSYTYQWIRVATDNTETNISSATASTYTLVAADQGTTVKVTVSFTDDANNPETLTSAATATVSAAANTLATGAPTITGTAQVGQTLTAGTTAIMDADGLTSVSYTYQWIRVATDNTETNISSATASTYMLVAADQGTTVKVTVSFTDDANNPETLTSAATATVSAAANTLATGAPTITGTAQVGQTLTAGTTAIMDADGLTSVSYTYQWIRVATDNTETNISSATASTYMLVAADQGTTVKVTVSFTDDANNPETLTSAATATVSAAANTLATGAPTITGTAQVGQTLTASTTGIADANGLTTPNYTYQWIRVDGTDEADIASANSSTYPLGAADLGTTLKVRVTFADDLGHTETLTSAATATVGAVATAPTVTDVAVTSTPASGTTYYLAGEVIEFTVTFSAPVTVTGTPKFAFRLGAATRQAAYARGSDSAALVFARTVQAGEVDRNGISWNSLALAVDGGTITQTGATTAARLTHAEQASLEGHRVDAAPPMQVSASVQGLSLVLVYDEPLDPASMPATGAYTVTATVGATTTTPAVSEVSIYGIWVTLTLDAAPAAGATVTLAYAPPASNPVQDEAGNDAPAFSGQKVNGAAGNTAPTGAPTITGTAEVGETLTAVTTGIADADGLTSPAYTYQWIRVNGTEADIAGENSSTYTLVDADLGTTLKVRVSFTDDASNSETLTSAATATVGAAATAPTVSTVAVTSMPASGDTYGTGEMIRFTVTFDQDVTVTGTPEFEFCLGSTATVSCSVGTPPPALRSAALSSGSGMTTLVFSYTVVAGDMDTDGIWIGNHDRTIKLDTGDAIRGTGGGLDAVLTHAEEGTQPGHKVNGEATDRAALVALYNATSGPNWTINTNWLTTAALSEWYGVTTDVDGRVTHVYLAQNELNGELPVELGDLTNLQILYLNQNMLSGAIPAALGDLASLQILYLAQNELSGAIPAKLGI